MNPYQNYTVPTQEGGLYHKWEDGKQYRFRLASEPVVYESVFERGEERNVSIKYAWLAWDVDASQARIVQLPLTGYKMIHALAVDPDWGDPASEDGYGLSMKRTGTGLETEYTITPSPKRASLSDFDGAEEAIAKLNLIELVEKGKGNQNVNYLSDAIKGKKSEHMTKKEVLDKEYADNLPDDEELEKPIDLSEIPF